MGEGGGDGTLLKCSFFSRHHTPRGLLGPPVKTTEIFSAYMSSKHSLETEIAFNIDEYNAVSFHFEIEMFNLI